MRPRTSRSRTRSCGHRAATTSTSQTTARPVSSATTTRCMPAATASWFTGRKNFTDILDWQDDVALYDLHSVGSTVVHPQDGKPHFVDATNNNFQLLPLVGGQTAANAALQQGNPLIAFTTAPSSANLLTNPGFENGLTGWTSSTGGSAAGSGTETGYPAAYDGGSYFAAGTVQQGFVTQTVNLLRYWADRGADRRRRSYADLWWSRAVRRPVSRRIRARSRCCF